MTHILLYPICNNMQCINHLIKFHKLWILNLEWLYIGLMSLRVFVLMCIIVLWTSYLEKVDTILLVIKIKHFCNLQVVVFLYQRGGIPIQYPPYIIPLQYTPSSTHRLISITKYFHFTTQLLCHVSQLTDIDQTN